MLAINRALGTRVSEKGIADADNALKEAEEIGHAGTLLFALMLPSRTHIQCGNYMVVKAR